MVRLDDQNNIMKYDLSGMEDLINSMPKQCYDAFRIGSEYLIPKTLKKRYKNIVCTGLGGSAIGADIVRSYIIDELKIPFFINRKESLPGFVDEDTLFIVSSYSGNTEDILKAYSLALSRRVKIIAITSGGKLYRRALRDKIPVLTIPPFLPPRSAIGYSSILLLVVLSRLGMVSDKSGFIRESISIMEELRDNKIGCGIKSDKNIAKSLACRLHGRIPVIYSAEDHIGVVTTRWRSQIAENAKTISFNNVFPEMAHNEIVGWKNPSRVLKYLSVVMLRDCRDASGVSKIMDISSKVIAGESVDVFNIESRGRGLLARIFSLIYIGDFVSFYLAILNRCDPTSIERIARIKKEIKAT